LDDLGCEGFGQQRRGLQVRWVCRSAVAAADDVWSLTIGALRGFFEMPNYKCDVAIYGS
jgi:hypothetical protein